MYELVEEASKVLRNPTEKFNFDDPQCDPQCDPWCDPCALLE